MYLAINRDTKLINFLEYISLNARAQINFIYGDLRKI